MDTTPFHLILCALNLVLLGGLFLWFRFRRDAGSGPSTVYHFEKSLYVPVAVRSPSLTWDFAGIILFGGFGLACFVALSRLICTGFVQEHVYHFNVGQCIVEGIAVHGTLFLIGTALLLYWNRRRFFAVFFGGFALVLAAFGFNVLYWEPYHLRVEHYEIRTTKIKKPLRIVFVSDIQTDRIGFHEINTMKKIQQQNADLIILGGDYIQTFADTPEQHLPEKFRQMFLDYPLHATLGVYAVAGNVSGHAGVRDADLFKGTSVEFVQNTVLYPNVGEDKGWSPPIDLVLLRLDHSLRGVDDRGIMDSGNFVVMAGHYPNYAIDGSGYVDRRTGKPRSGYRQQERAPDLMLAGHTHGGQIVLPFYGTVIRGGGTSVEHVPHDMMGGFFPYPNGGHLLITRGSGLERGWAPRIRLFCPAEISVIDIIPESP